MHINKLRSFLSLVKPKRNTLIILVILVVALKYAQLLPTILIGQIIDTIQKDIHSDTIITKVIECLLLSVSFLVLLPLQSYLLSHFTQTLVASQSLDWLSQIIKKPFSFFSNYTDIFLYKTLDRGMLALERGLMLIFLTLIPLLAELVVAIFYFMSKAHSSFILLLLLLSVVQVFIVLLVVRWRRQHIKDLNDAEDDLAEHTMNLFGTALGFKLANAIDNAVNFTKPSLQNYQFNATRVSISASFLNAISVFLRYAGTVLALLLGIVLVTRFHQNLSIGELIINFTIITSFLVSVESMAMSYREIDNIQVDMQNLKNVLAWQPPTHSPNIDKTFADSDLTLVDANNPDFNYHFAKGSKILIMGESGSGKTTFVESIMGIRPKLHDYQFITDNQPYHTLSESSLVRQVQYLPQTAILFYGKLHQAVYFSQKDSDEIRQALAKMNLSERVLADDFCVDKEDDKLSAGEKMRLHFSKLLTAPQPIAILDEPTNALDEKNRQLMWSHIFNSPKTVIVISHDLSRLADFDAVIEIGAKKIINVTQKSLNDG